MPGMVAPRAFDFLPQARKIVGSGVENDSQLEEVQYTAQRLEKLAMTPENGVPLPSNIGKPRYKYCLRL